MNLVKLNVKNDICYFPELKEPKGWDGIIIIDNIKSIVFESKNILIASNDFKEDTKKFQLLKFTSGTKKILIPKFRSKNNLYFRVQKFNNELEASIHLPLYDDVKYIPKGSGVIWSHNQIYPFDYNSPFEKYKCDVMLFIDNEYKFMFYTNKNNKQITNELN